MRLLRGRKEYFRCGVGYDARRYAYGYLHLSISDATGDNAIFEYVDGKLDIHHSKAYQVMTNSPVFDQQLALDDYWKNIGGTLFARVPIVLPTVL